MSPFSVFLCQIRESRNIRQKDVAILLGYEQSYISALETGAKGVPQEEFIQTLIKKLQLSAEEITVMHIALADSRRTLTIPVTAKMAEFRLAHQFERLLGHLSAKQIQFLELALELSGSSESESIAKTELLRENKM